MKKNQLHRKFFKLRKHAEKGQYILKVVSTATLVKLRLHFIAIVFLLAPSCLNTVTIQSINKRPGRETYQRFLWSLG